MAASIPASSLSSLAPASAFGVFSYGYQPQQFSLTCNTMVMGCFPANRMLLPHLSRPTSSCFNQTCASNKEKWWLGCHQSLKFMSCRVAFWSCNAPKFGTLCCAKLDREEGLEQPGSGKITQGVLWTILAFYVSWLFLSPAAPGDPVWAIKPETVSMIKDLSLNFFFILPLCNAAGINFMVAPVLHPAAEALFNLVIGWTFMFAPLIFTDLKHNRFRGSLEALWLGQMFLTNVFLIPYMAIRMNKNELEEEVPSQLTPSCQEHSILYKAMVSGAQIVGLVGGLVGVVSVLWIIAGRSNGNFGNLADRLSFFVDYVNSDRLAYAFLWDAGLYSVFQPWLIGDNIENVDERKQSIVKKLRFVPYLGLVAYLWGMYRPQKGVM